jgi:archaeal preflagellin peptidase FlaK
VTEASSLLDAGRATVLVAGLAYAAVEDVEAREVADGLWQVVGVVGAAAGAAALFPGGPLPIALWVVVAVLALEHLFPWDDALGDRHARKVPALELGAFVAAIAAVGYAVVRYGVGPSSVPVDVLAALATVVLARILFELGVLYGGADAKALIVAGLLVPVFATPLIFHPAVAAGVLGVLPFSVTLLTDAALLSVAVPVAIAIRNVARGEFSFPRGFTGYTLAVEELPQRFVWVRDPAAGEDTLVEDAETSAEDIRRRTEVAAELRRKGVTRVWVTPQLPFLVLMASGAVAALLAGNLLLDLFAAL